MPFLVLDQTDQTKVIDCTRDNEGGVEISTEQACVFRYLHFSQVRYIDGVLVEPQEARDEWQAHQHRVLLQRELDTLQIATSKVSLWLIKLLIQKGVINQSELPAKLIAYKDRSEEIEAELNT